jgi:phosphatidylserine/phosphatidylglycerophosphate/cardiolipin synthase-like enzyme
MLRAERSIFIVAWDIDGRITLPRHGADDSAPEQFRDFIDYLARRRPKLTIYVLLWDYSILYAGGRQPLPTITIDWSTPKNVRLVLDDRVPLGGSHHQKIVSVDDTLAFVGGIDLTRHRWDTPDHAPEDPRRVDHEGKPYPPFHDVQLVVDGPAARAVAELCHWRWEQSTGETLELATVPAAPWPDDLPPSWCSVAVGIARTLPAEQERPGTREILELYTESIAAAQHSIYIENQYLAADPIAEALAVRLTETDGPEVVIVSQWATSTWLEEQVMGVRRDQFIARLQEADEHARLRILAPTVPGLSKEDYYLHSKIAVIDDCLVQIGSANLNNRSLGYDSECNLAIECQNEQERAAACSFRNRLLAEHLGEDPDTVQTEIERCGSLVAAIDGLRAREGRRLAELDSPAAVPRPLEAVAELGDPEKPLMSHAWFKKALPEKTRVSDQTPNFRLKALLAAFIVLVSLIAIWFLLDFIEIFV